MANKRTLALTKEQYTNIIGALRTGFIYNDKEFRSNSRIATILVLQANLGLRIGDILQLKLSSIIKDGNRYRLDIIEDKTNKTRTFTVPTELYNYIADYCIDNKIHRNVTIFQLTERAIQKQLKIVCEYLGYEGISTHSFRKYYATNIYVNNDYNIMLVKELLQHSSTVTTQKYIGISTQDIERAIQNNIDLL